MRDARGQIRRCPAPGSSRRPKSVLHAAVVVVLTALAAGRPSLASAQVSPGPLSAAHAELDRNSGCVKCHGKGQDQSAAKCLDCHKEIGALVDQGRGLHAREGKKVECARCHPEHGGRDFALVEWGGRSVDAFDHARAGWALAGKHAKTKCRECHKPAFQKSESFAQAKRKDPSRSWIGLETTCQSCHEDVHRGTLGSDCTRCHGHDAWKPAPGFDHAKTQFVLTGKHIEVACAKCHQADRLQLAKDAAGRPVPLYKPLPHAECSACHTDVHKGSLGPECSRCHTTESFKKIDPNRFDHARTKFPLKGKHAAVQCQKCHDEKSAWGKQPPFATCAGCHTDPHAGQATLAGRAADCGACHNESAFKPATFSVAQHAQSKYPLEGKHQQVKCADCHGRKPAGGTAAVAVQLGKAGVWFRPPSAQCGDCHTDAHGGQLAQRADQGACESCHSVRGFRPSTFDLAKHAATRLPLDGRHAKLQCSACHGPERPGLPPVAAAAVIGRARVLLRFEDVGCVACHRDPHEGRFAVTGERPRKDGCRACHAMEHFQPSSVDAAAHATARFALEGAHRAVPCFACHEDLTLPAGRAAGRIAGASLVAATAQPRKLLFHVDKRNCRDCHRSPHGTQFDARKDGGACDSCHGVEGFRPASRFDHKKQAKFPLEGAHQRVACNRCHPSAPGAEGKDITVYRPIASSCESCHGGKTMPPLRGES